MLVIILDPAYIVTPIVAFSILLVLYYSSSRQWLLQKRNGGKVLLICTLILVPLNLYCDYDRGLLYQGSISFFWVHSFNLGPNENLTSPSLQNTFTITGVGIYIQLSDGGPVNLLLIDENNPTVEHEVGTYNTTSIRVDLPYRYSAPFVAALWFVCIQNPSLTANATGRLMVDLGPMEADVYTMDLIYLGYLYRIPLFVLIEVWALAGVISFIVWFRKSGKTVWETYETDRRKSGPEM